MSRNQLARTKLQEDAALLSNAITSCMIANEMTLEVLGVANTIVKNVYEKNATIKKVSESQPN